MSEITPQALSYRAMVAEYFLGLRGCGLLLAPLDEDLLVDWERRGLPIAVVCRGLRRGLEQRLEERGDRTRLPHSLRAYRFAVEEEWRAYRHGRVGEASTAGSEDLAARERLEAASRYLEDAARADEAWRETYRIAARVVTDVVGTGRPPLEPQSVRRTDSPLTLDQVERALTVADGILINAWLASLPRRERAAVGTRLQLLAGVRPRRTRPGAFRLTLRSHLLDAARRAGLRCLRGSV